MRTHSNDIHGKRSGAQDTGASSNAVSKTSSAWEIDHGEHCACLLLAAACGANPESITFSCCRNVLQKHWRTACEHGEHSPVQRASKQWRSLGEIDPIKAVLIREG